MEFVSPSQPTVSSLRNMQGTTKDLRLALLRFLENQRFFHRWDENIRFNHLCSNEFSSTLRSIVTDRTRKPRYVSSPLAILSSDSS